VAILVPFRNRELQLRVFLSHLHPFLQKQFVDYTIFVVEQAGNDTYNKGALFNIGYLEAQRMSGRSLECMILHDVDLLPEDDHILYLCDNQSASHLSEGIDKFGYKQPYPKLLGGVTSIRACDYERINGFSNMFFGWGGEDDDLYNRVTTTGVKILRYSYEVSRSRFRHTKANHVSGPPSQYRYKLLRNSMQRRTVDGLSSIGKLYTANATCRHTYTHILAELRSTELLAIRDRFLGKQAWYEAAQMVC
jgi:beta-1,4-galactosyltransferase 1